LCQPRRDHAPTPSAVQNLRADTVPIRTKAAQRRPEPRSIGQRQTTSGLFNLPRTGLIDTNRLKD
jgi:hypothetical protein